MADNETTLLITAKETAVVALNRVAKSLEAVSVASGNLTKDDKALQTSVAKTTALLNDQAGGITKVTTAASREAAAFKQVVAAQSAINDAIAKQDAALNSATGKAVQLSSAYHALAVATDEAFNAEARLDLAQSQLSPRAAAIVANNIPIVASSTSKSGLATGSTKGTGVAAGGVSEADAAAVKEYNIALAQNRAAIEASIGANLDLVGVQNLVAASTERAAVATDASSSSLSKFIANSTGTRHALNEASSSLALFGAALLAIPVASALVAVDFQKDFAQVQRALVGGAGTAQLDSIKQALLSLSETTPTSFKNLTQIAAAGSQMGVSANDIVKFTKTVAELTLTTNVSAQSAESFIRKFQLIAGVGGDQFANLTSALLNVGIHTGATEKDIATLATQIIAVGKVAGFTTPDVIGLAAAFASINSTGPSRARGTVVRLVTDIQTAIHSADPTALVEFANVAGTTSEKVSAAFGTAKFTPIFESFIDGLGKIAKAGGNTVDVLNTLGITSTVDVPLIQSLAAAHVLLHTAITDANEGYKDAGILAQHYAVVNDTVSAKVTELKNAFGVVANSIGSAAIPAFTNLTQVFEGAAKGLAAFAQTNEGGDFLNSFAWTAVVGGALLLMVSAAGAAISSVLAITKAVTGLRAGMIAAQAAGTNLGVALTFIAGPGGVVLAGFLAIAAAVVALTAFMNSQRASATDLSNALDDTTKSYSKQLQVITQGDDVRNALDIGTQNTTTSFKHLDASLNETHDVWLHYWDGVGNPAYSNFINDTKKIGTSLAQLSQNNLPAAQEGFDDLAAKTNGSSTELFRLLAVMPDYKTAIDQMLVSNGKAVTTQNELALATGATTDKAKAVSDAIKSYTSANAAFINNLKEDLGGISTKQLTTLTDAYTKSVQPLVDLNSLVGEVQTANQKLIPTYDGVSVSLAQITKQYVDNNAAQAQWAGNLVTVAQKYGQQAADQFISAGYSAVNGSILNQLANASPAQGAAYENAVTAAVAGASAAAGQTLIDAGGLVVKGGGQIGAQTAQAIGNALQAGFSPDDIMKKFNLQFAASAKALTTAPVPINFDPVLDQKGVDAMFATLKAQGGPLGGKGTTTVTPSLDPKGVATMNAELGKDHVTPVTPKLDEGKTADMWATIAKSHETPVAPKLDEKKVSGMWTTIGQSHTTPVVPDLKPGQFNKDLNTLLSPKSLTITVNEKTGALVPGGANGGYFNGRPSGTGKGYAGGGYTGNGSMYQPAGIVHAGEFVMTKAATATIGIDNLYALMNSVKHSQHTYGYASGGAVGGGSGNGNLIVSLSATDRMLLAQAGNVKLYLDGQQLSASSGKQDVIANTRRAN